MQLSKWRLALIVILALVIGWMANDYMTPTRNRPVLKFIRNWWWVPLLLDEPQKTDTSRLDSCHEDGQVGPDGYRLVHHGRAL